MAVPAVFGGVDAGIDRGPVGRPRLHGLLDRSPHHGVHEVAGPARDADHVALLHAVLRLRLCHQRRQALVPEQRRREHVLAADVARDLDAHRDEPLGRRPCSCFFLNSNIAAESSAEAGDYLEIFANPMTWESTIYLHLSKIRVRCNALI